MIRLLLVFLCTLCASVAYADSKGGLICPNGKIEAKSFGAYYVPEKGNFGMVFFKDAATEEEIDAAMAEQAKFWLGRAPKGPAGKRLKYLPLAFKIVGKVNKSVKKTDANELAKGYTSFHYVCEKTENVVDMEMKERATKTKAFIQNISADMKQGGKVDLNTKGDFAGDPKDKQKVKVAWKIQGSTKLRVYE